MRQWMLRITAFADRLRVFLGSYAINPVSGAVDV
jgi:hypothetical protein